MDYKDKLEAIERRRDELKKEYAILKEERKNLDFTDETVWDRFQELCDHMDEIRNELEFDLPREHMKICQKVLDDEFERFLERIAP